MIVLLCADILDTNQYIHLLTDAYQKMGHQVILGADNLFYCDIKPNFVHFQWPEALYKWRNISNQSAVTRLNDRILWFVKKKIPIVATCHNIQPHDYASPFYDSIYDNIYSNAQIIVHHGKASIDILKEAIPGCRYSNHIICPHGPYPFKLFNPEEARKFYGVPPESFVMLNFGYQRHYKGHNFINKVFNKWRKNTFLFTVGQKFYPNAYRSHMHNLMLGVFRELSPYFYKIISFKIMCVKTIIH